MIQSILLHGVISLPDATSYDKWAFNVGFCSYAHMGKVHVPKSQELVHIFNKRLQFSKRIKRRVTENCF